MNRSESGKICFIICWLGKLPGYLLIWLKTCEPNKEYTFLLFTDDSTFYPYPANVKYIPFSKKVFLARVKERLEENPSFKEAYRLCDFRPMYGVIFKEELAGYDYWGYCDIDVVFGRIKDFLPPKEVYQYDAIFNGGHFTIIKNDDRMNYLFKEKGALFGYKTVMRNDAIFAFDETTGIQKIAKVNKVNAKFGIPYIETESKFMQLRSRLEQNNPDIQGYYWENGDLVRVKVQDKHLFYQKIAYIHLQKREIGILDKNVCTSNRFWVTPKGYAVKQNPGIPQIQEVEPYNPFEGIQELDKQARKYKMMKIKQILKRTPFQIYVRIRQQKAGINSGDGSREEMKWKEL